MSRVTLLLDFVLVIVSIVFAGILANAVITAPTVAAAGIEVIILVLPLLASLPIIFRIRRGPILEEMDEDNRLTRCISPECGRLIMTRQAAFINKQYVPALSPVRMVKGIDITKAVVFWGCPFCGAQASPAMTIDMIETLKSLPQDILKDLGVGY